MMLFKSKNKPTPLLSVILNHSSTRPPSPHPFMTQSSSTDGGATNSNDACSSYREPFSSFSPPSEVSTERSVPTFAF